MRVQVLKQWGPHQPGDIIGLDDSFLHDNQMFSRKIVKRAPEGEEAKEAEDDTASKQIDAAPTNKMVESAANKQGGNRRDSA